MFLVSLGCIAFVKDDVTVCHRSLFRPFFDAQATARETGFSFFLLHSSSVLSKRDRLSTFLKHVPGNYTKKESSLFIFLESATHSPIPLRSTPYPSCASCSSPHVRSVAGAVLNLLIVTSSRGLANRKFLFPCQSPGSDPRPPDFQTAPYEFLTHWATRSRSIFKISRNPATCANAVPTTSMFYSCRKQAVLNNISLCAPKTHCICKFEKELHSSILELLIYLFQS